MRLRFAPSPTGYLHVGGARTALFNWLLARQSGGSFILRIEDTDRDRSQPEHVKAILNGMEWLGLDWDEGPFFQAEGVARHRADALALLESGLAYRDFTSPDDFALAREAAKTSGAGSFARLPRELAAKLSQQEQDERAEKGEPFAVRFRVPDGVTEWYDLVHGALRFENQEIEDLVILRSDGTPTYNLAVVSDDADMNVTHVLRGDDHISNTPKQILLYQALGQPVPVFGHLPMILGPDGKRLSKRHGATAVESYGADGIFPEAMVNFLALLGWSPGDDQEMFSLQELVKRFSMERVLKKGSVFDTDKLLWFNGQHLGRMDLKRIRSELEGSWSNMDTVPPGPPVDLSADGFSRLVEALKPRSRTVAEMADQALPFVFEELVYEPNTLEKTWYKDPEATVVRLEAALDVVRSVDWSSDALEAGLRAAAERLEVGAGKLFQPLRSALTGRSASPGIFDVLLILGRARSITRLEQAIPMVKERVETPASE